MNAAMRLGIDVGGTNTDAVLLDGERLVAAAKTATTPDILSGILEAVRRVRAAGGADGRRPLEAAIVGTTQFVNAVAQGRSLAPVAAIRLATPPQTLPPLVDWPPFLRDALAARTYVCAGGSQYDGRPLNPLDERELARIAAELAEAGITQVALSAVFAPVDAAVEERAAEVLHAHGPELDVTLSHEIGRIGLLERENATVLNASLRPLAEQVGDSLAELLGAEEIAAPVYLSQNDGTLMELSRARRFPIFTVASGATNSMRGAARLTGIEDCVVLDVGGTTSEVGMLTSGFPRESTVAVDLAGVRTNFRMPDVISLALGGGSLVGADGSVGPESVGLGLTREARVFGGATTTLTDAAVALGLVEIGDVAPGDAVPRELAERAMARAKQRLADAVERTKLVAADIPVVAVGGGALLFDELPGQGEVVRPEHSGCANAIGAGLAQVGGDVQRIYSLAEGSRADARADARAEAIRRAVAAGAEPASVRVLDEEDIPLTHLASGAATQVRVKVVGDLRPEGE